MSNVPAFIERLRLIAKALEESQPNAKARAVFALRAAADHIAAALARQTGGTP